MKRSAENAVHPSTPGTPSGNLASRPSSAAPGWEFSTASTKRRKCIVRPTNLAFLAQTEPPRRLFLRASP